MTTPLPAPLRAVLSRVAFGILCLSAAPAPVCAQRATAAAVPQVAPAAAPAPAIATAGAESRRADDIRGELNELLQEHPPSVREVLQREPALVGNADYLAPYPRLAAYLAAHPEIARAPAYFLGEPYRNEPGADPTWMWRELTSMIAVGTLLLGAALGFGWLIRTALDHRRWQRVSRTQVETHTKLLDRMTSSEELRSYMESPAGRRFLESAPIALDGQSSPIAAPVSRILWSLQVGVVVLALGIALQAVSRGVAADAAQPLRVLGILATATGVGFIVSAGLAYVLSRHLGLIGGDRASSPASVRS
ncbi:hypothetical protein [Luteitalea sp.]|uniref:hypothetical protein n=1 Tax=Luteitalea sp. TaxID=2004800 RepID=UPI0037C785A4